jgi:hypothetical protein
MTQPSNVAKGLKKKQGSTAACFTKVDLGWMLPDVAQLYGVLVRRK